MFYKTRVGLKSDKEHIQDDNVKFRDLVMNPDHFREAMTYLKDGSEGKFGAQIGFELGVRSSSIEKLRYGDLHFDRNKIDIVNAKGGKTYDLPMLQRVMDWLKSECVQRAELSNDELIN